MASQVSHIVYAKKYFNSFELSKSGDSTSAGKALSSEGKINKDEFFLGCVFPDIRRVDPRIKRKSTHLYFPVLDLDFKAISSFEAGWKFHLYCDMRREEILNKYDFYSLKGASDFYSIPAKILEDEIVYDSYNNWEKVKNYFNNAPYPHLEQIKITPETFRLWYAVVAKYTENKPNDKSMRIFLSKQPSLRNDIDNIMRSLKKLRTNGRVAEILGKIKDEIV